MELRKDIVHISRKNEHDDFGYMEGTPAERLEIVWEITKDVWAFKGELDAEQRLQRNITNIIRRKS